jgi:hypothetical protein
MTAAKASLQQASHPKCATENISQATHTPSTRAPVQQARNHQQQSFVFCTRHVLPYATARRCFYRRQRRRRIERSRVCALHAAVKQAAGDNEEFLRHHLVHGVAHAFQFPRHAAQASHALHVLRLQLRVRIPQQLQRAEEVAACKLLLNERRSVADARSVQRDVQQLAQPLPAPRQPCYLLLCYNFGPVQGKLQVETCSAEPTISLSTVASAERATDVSRRAEATSSDRS